MDILKTPRERMMRSTKLAKAFQDEVIRPFVGGSSESGSEYLSVNSG